MTTPPDPPAPPGPALPEPPTVPRPAAALARGPADGQGHYWTPDPEPVLMPARDMAGWSLGLAIAGFFPPAMVVSIGLAVAVLVRSRDGRDRGKGLAIGALITDACWILGYAAVFLGLAIGRLDEPERGLDGQVTEDGEVSTLRLRVGDCVNDDALTGLGDGESVSARSIEVVPCSSPHQLEVFHDFELTGVSYPGDDTVSTLATTGCTRAYRDFVGIGFSRSELDVYDLFPRRSSWTSLNDRAVTCLIGDPDGPTTGTLEDSRR